MATYNSTNARKNFFNLLQHVASTHEVLTITAKQGNVVMLSQDDWENISETLHLTAIPGMSKSIKDGMEVSPEDCNTDLAW